jgi:hypothetical protein
LKTTEDILREAIRTKNIIKISYNGGSQPGAIRKILPIKIDGEYLELQCLSSKKQERFPLDKIYYAGKQAESYDRTLDYPLVTCVVCGKKFHSKEEWRTYCTSCYIEKMRREGNSLYYENYEDNDDNEEEADDNENYTPHSYSKSSPSNLLQSPSNLSCCLSITLICLTIASLIGVVIYIIKDNVIMMLLMFIACFSFIFINKKMHKKVKQE